jgi:glycosyltransferase involved in cell wall biosynthesis
MNNSIKITVIVPSYNQGKYIENVIQSVINQTYDNWELIIQDGASNDCTADVCKKYVSIDTRISFASEKDNGYADAVNKALDRATGELAVIQSSDDFFAYNKVFEDVVSIWEKNKDLLIISGSSVSVDEDLKSVYTREIVDKYVPVENIFTTKDHFSQGATFFSIRRALAIGKLNINVDMVADTDFWIRMACSEPIYINSILQTSKIYVGVVIQKEQRSSDYSKFCLGRAQIAVNFLYNETIPFDIKYKKNNANNFIKAGICHYKGIEKDILPFRMLYRQVNGIDYSETLSHKEKNIKGFIKILKRQLKHLIYGKEKIYISNSASEIYIVENKNKPLINYKWWTNCKKMGIISEL